MKKLLLGLGTLSLAILPVAAMVSCSSTAPTLDTEAAKLNVSVATKDKTIKAWPAADEINKAVGAPAKKAALEKIVVIPTIDSGFTYEVQSAVVNHTTHTQVDATILVTQTGAAAGSNTKTAVLKVTGLTAVVPTLDTEAAKFETPVVTKTPITEATEAAASIKTGDTPAQRLTALELFATVPTINANFTFTVDSAAIVEATPTQVDVKITVTDTKSTAAVKTKEVTFKVTGLASSTLAKQAALFTTSAFKGDVTDATAALQTITDASGAAAKQTALQAISTETLPTLAEGFTYEVQSGVVDADKTSITVTILVTQTAGTTGSNTTSATFKVTGFTAPTTPGAK